MTLLSEIGQPTFVEVIRVDPFIGTTCESLVVLGASRWQNPRNRFDVNGDGVVDESDYNILLQYIGQFGQGQLPGLKPESDPWVDVNGDGAVGDNDLQQLSNYLTGTFDTTEPVCHAVSDFRIERDLLDPNQIINCTTDPTVRSAACHKNIVPTANYTPYFNLYSGLLETTWDTVVKTKDSIIYVHNDLLVPRNQYFAGCSDTPRVLNRILKRLQTGPFGHRYDPRHPLPDRPETPGWKPPVYPIPPPDIPDEPIIPRDPVPGGTTTTTTTPEPSDDGIGGGVVIINIFGDAHWYLNTEAWYAWQSNRVISNSVPYGDILWDNGFEASGSHYIDDRTLWDQFVDRLNTGSVKVRVGILHPKGTGEVWPSDQDLPKDTDRGEIDYIPYEFKNPRISASNIINAFNIITRNGEYVASRLIIVSDVSEDEQWADAIVEASAQLGTDYPRMHVEKYPFSKPFSRWIMMDLDIMRQLTYSRDNVNDPSLHSMYNQSIPPGTITDPVGWQQVRIGNIESRLLTNDARVNHWYYNNNGVLESKPKYSTCYAIMRPYGWRISPSDMANPTRSFTSKPFFVYNQSAEYTQWSLAQYWVNYLVIPTIDTVEGYTAPSQYPILYPTTQYDTYMHYAFPTSYLAAYMEDMEHDILIGSFAQYTPNASLRATAISDGNAGAVAVASGPMPLQRPMSVPNIYMVTHLDAYYGLVRNVPNPWGVASPLLARPNYFVSVWYNDLHAVVTEGTIGGVRTAQPYAGGDPDVAHVRLEERQRAIVVYSDPDFQDKIYDVVKYFYEQGSYYLTVGGEGSRDKAFDYVSWARYEQYRFSEGGFLTTPSVPTETGPWLLSCPSMDDLFRETSL